MFILCDIDIVIFILLYGHGTIRSWFEYTILWPYSKFLNRFLSWCFTASSSKVRRYCDVKISYNIYFAIWPHGWDQIVVWVLLGLAVNIWLNFCLHISQYRHRKSDDISMWKYCMIIALVFFDIDRDIWFIFRTFKAFKRLLIKTLTWCDSHHFNITSVFLSIQRGYWRFASWTLCCFIAC